MNHNSVEFGKIQVQRICWPQEGTSPLLFILYPSIVMIGSVNPTMAELFRKREMVNILKCFWAIIQYYQLATLSVMILWSYFVAFFMCHFVYNCHISQFVI